MSITPETPAEEVARISSENFSIRLAQACLMGCVEGAIGMRGTCSDAGILDMIEAGMKRAQDTINEIRGKQS